MSGETNEVKQKGLNRKLFGIVIAAILVVCFRI